MLTLTNRSHRRHAYGTSPVANPPNKWDAKTNIKWKVDLPDRGRATSVTWIGRGSSRGA